MTSQITKDFRMKSKLRKLADGGSPDPSMLGTGAAARAGRLLAGRGRQIDDAVDAAAGAPAPAPAPTPPPAPQTPKKSGLRSLLGLADGGTYLDDDYNTNVYQQSQLKDGGRVNGPGGRTDDKVGPVMLSDEEYVLPGDTADAIGRDNLDAIRLATHDFKDERKESKLRKAQGLADGGSPWIADDKGNVRKPNAFGDAAAGPGYQQPRLPPPQPGTAVGPSAMSPGAAGPRTINMGMVDEVPRTAPQQLRAPTAPTAYPSMGPVSNPNVGPNGSREAQAFRNAAGNSFGDAAAAAKDTSLASRAGSALRATGSVLAKGAGVVGGGLAAKDMYDNGVNVGNAGDLAASAATFAGPVGVAGATGWGVGRAVGNNLSEDTRDIIGGTINQGVRNVGKLFGQDWGVDDSALLQSKAEERMRAVNPTTAQPSPVAAATSALRSDQGPAQPVTPGSYQSRRLSEMGVPLDVQNSEPVVDSVGNNTRDFLRTGGTSQYQNLGTYGGNGNIYGKADDPSRPGRINNFVGVGAGASPANEASGSGFNSAITSALRGLGSGPSAPGGSNSGGGGRVSVIGGEDRYDKLAKELRGMYSAKGQGNLAKKLVELEQLRADEQGNIRSDATLRANEQLRSETLMRNADLVARTNMIEALSRMEEARGSLTAQAQAAQRKAIEDARKIGEERDADSVKAYESVADTFAAGDKEKAKYYREVLSTLGPKHDQIAQGLTHTDKRAFYTNILRQQIGRDEGLVLGRDVGATVQNAALGALIGRMSRFGNGPAGKAIDKALGKIPRVGPVLSALRPVENLARFGPILGAGVGAMVTPEIEEYTRYDPIAYDPVSGAPLPAKKDAREAFQYGVFDTYLNPFNDDVQTVSGRRTNRPNPTEVEAARRYRATLRTE